MTMKRDLRGCTRLFWRSLISNPVSSMCYDAYGSYVPAGRVSAFVNLGILALYLLLFAMAKKERAAFVEEAKHD